MSGNMFKNKTVEAGGEKYTVQEITVRQRRDIFAQHKKEQDATTMSANLVLMGCVEFKDKTLDEVFDLPGSVFDEISNAVADVSGMGSTTVDSEEGEEKND